MSFYTVDSNPSERLRYLAFNTRSNTGGLIPDKPIQSTKSSNPVYLPPINIKDKNANAAFSSEYVCERLSDDETERMQFLSEEVNVRDVFSKEPTSKHILEAEWYKVKDIKSSLVDINAQRIFKILTEGAQDMDLSLLIPLFVRNLMDLPADVFALLRNPLLKFQSLLEDFINETGTSINRNRNQMISHQNLKMRHAHSIESNIKRHLRTIFKTVKTSQADEDIQTFVDQLQSHKQAAVQKFQKEFDRFREAMHGRLGLNQRHLTEEADLLHHSVRRKVQQQEEIGILEGKLSKHGEQTKKLCDELDKQIEKVALDAANVKKNSALQVKTRNGILSQIHDASAHSKKRQEKLEHQRKEAQIVLNHLIDEHNKEETKLREKKYKMETERDNWIMKYDADMGKVQDQFDALWVDYSAQRKILDALEEKFSVLEITYNEIIEIRAAEEEERTRARRELLEMNTSAAIIQAFWRTRAVLKRLQSKGKKKGKKK